MSALVVCGVSNGWAIDHMPFWSKVRDDQNSDLNDRRYCASVTSAAARAGGVDLMRTLHAKPYRWGEHSRKGIMNTSLDEAMFHRHQSVIDSLLLPIHELGNMPSLENVIRDVIPGRRVDAFKQMIGAKNRPVDFELDD